MIQYELLFKAQNGERNCTKPGLLLDCKDLSICLLANQCTYLGIINGVRAIVYKIVLHPNSKNILSDIIKANDNQAYLKGLIL